MELEALPNVFVVPPAEEKRPPWCFFDSEDPALSQILETSDADISCFSFDEEAPTDGTVSVVDALMRDIVENSDTDSEFKGRIMSYKSRNQVCDDSDVIEVVKVSRRKYLEDEQVDMQSLQAPSDHKPTSSLKSRATKVFRSIKGSLRSSKPRAQGIFPSEYGLSNLDEVFETVEHPPPQQTSRPGTPTISRRGSRILSQIFSPPSLKSRSSISSFDQPTATFVAEIPTAASQFFSPERDSVSRVSSRQSSLYNVASQDQARFQASSPVPTFTTTTTSIKSYKSRFSKFKFRRFFPGPFSSSTPSNIVASSHSFDETRCPTPVPSSSWTSPSATSSASTMSIPQTPPSFAEVSDELVQRKVSTDSMPFDSVESMFDNNVGLNLGLSLGLDSQQMTPKKASSSNNRSNSWRSITPNIRPLGKATTPQGSNFQSDPGDTSFEMRLDSLHFDSLSFDADQFSAFER